MAIGKVRRYTISEFRKIANRRTAPTYALALFIQNEGRFMGYECIQTINSAEELALVIEKWTPHGLKAFYLHTEISEPGFVATAEIATHVKEPVWISAVALTK
jgi:hypothetical protein